ncbi:MAG: hypothetical protein LC744_03750 [Chloroflexi bacterium]|nr:hypothetical protein [Chloroflexota bacterium]
MPRRAGKAASRRARQRPVKRPLQHVVLPPAASPVPPVGTPDAREAISLDPPRRVVQPFGAVGSTLSARERAEYHYVERDLRNIAVLTALMALGLLAAWIAFSQLGLLA